MIEHITHWFPAGRIKRGALVAVALLAAPGCGNARTEAPTPIPPGPTQTPPAPETAPGMLIAYPPEPIAYFGKGDPHGQELLTDTLFSAFKIDEAAKPEWTTPGWHVQPNSDAAERVKWAPVSGQLGRFTLDLLQRADETYLVQRSFPVSIDTEKTYVSAHVQVKCSVPDAFGVIVTIPNADGDVDVGRGNSGSGDWEDVLVRAPIFGPQVRGPLTLKMVKRGGVDGSAMVRSASLKIDPAEQTSDPKRSLIDNGDFESFPFTKGFYPWKLARWGGTTADCALVHEQDGWCVSFAPVTPEGGVRISQRIYGLTQANLGMRLSAKASGIASEKMELVFAIRSIKDGQEWPEVTARTVHPGDGAWHEMALSVVLPPDRLPDTVYVDVYRKSVSDKPVLADNVRVMLGPK